jgi:hypothetical protein
MHPWCIAAFSLPEEFSMPDHPQLDCLINKDRDAFSGCGIAAKESSHMDRRTVNVLGAVCTRAVCIAGAE